MTVTTDPRKAARRGPAAVGERPERTVLDAMQPDGESGPTAHVPSREQAGGAWREGDHAGDRSFLSIGAFPLERGGALPDVTIAYETWGTLNAARDNVILVEHALTGDSHVVGDAGEGHASPGWWGGLVGPGRPIDTERWFVIASNVLGGCQGTTGPASTAPDGAAWGSRFPYITIRDQVNAEAAMLDRLGIDRLAAVIGGSMGGMRAIEWAATHPARVERCIVLASAAYATADQIAWCQPQLLAIRHDPDFAGGDYYDTGRSPDKGLGLARRIAHITYRTETELSGRFGRDAQPGEDPLGPASRGRFAVESYLDHHAGKLARRFDANAYLVLTEAMNSHDVGRDRGGLEAALSAVTADCTIVSVDTDRLYPPRLSDELARLLPRASRAEIHSEYGHDGFLIEDEQVGLIVAAALSR
jgi:homoserine O-acetyltransferase